MVGAVAAPEDESAFLAPVDTAAEDVACKKSGVGWGGNGELGGGKLF